MSRAWGMSGRMSYMNLLVYGPASQEFFFSQWLEHPTGAQKVIGSILLLSGTQIFSLSHAHDLLITSFLISSSRLKFTINNFITFAPLQN